MSGVVYKHCKMCGNMLPKRYERLPVEVSEFLGGGVGVGESTASSATVEKQVAGNTSLSVGAVTASFCFWALALAFIIISETQGKNMTTEVKDGFLYVGIPLLIICSCILCIAIVESLRSKK